VSLIVKFKDIMEYEYLIALIRHGQRPSLEPAEWDAKYLIDASGNVMDSGIA